MKPSTFDRDAAILDYTDTRERLIDLAKRYNVSTSTIHRELARRNTPLRWSERRRVDVDWDVIIREYIDSGSSEKVASRYGIAPVTLIRELKRRGIPRYLAGVAARQAMSLPDNPAVLGYIAAMVDGEGSIVNASLRCVNVTNTSETLMAWLLQFGGTVNWRDREAWKDGLKRKRCGVWVVSDAIGMHRLLTAIEPYLLIKRHLAARMLDTLESKYPTLTFTSWRQMPGLHAPKHYT